MESIKKYRYPGINSFETTDTDIFFGREDDRKRLVELVEIEKNVLLYSRSGLGKSSLFKAALIPELSIRGYQSFYIRLGLYQEDSLSPIQNVLRKTVLSEQKQLPVTFLQKFIDRSNSLWYAFKALQITQLQNQKPNEKPVILIFDQFEEIGSYNGQQLTDFKMQLAELLYTPIPKDYLDALKDDDLLTDPLTDLELDLLYKPLRVKVVFAIRSDQMSVLNQLSDYLPNILKVFYELKPLSPKQALSAVIEPALKDGSYITPVFSYGQDAVKKILKALSSEKSNDIDTAQLQILLQYIEQDIVEKKQDTQITGEGLGDLNKVYENYYRNSFQKLRTEQEQAQILIEDKLIVEGRRISYDKALCLQLVSEATLDALVETRLIRREPNTMGGYSYEVSHDSLIAPTLEAKKERLRLEEEVRQKTQYEAQLEQQRKKQQQQRIIIFIISAASLVSLVFLIFALIAQHNVEKTLMEVNRQKFATQKALNDFIKAEVTRKSIEKEQLLIEAKQYKRSKDWDLEKETEVKADHLEEDIKDLQKRLIK